MEKETHKTQIKWPILITENLETGKFTAILKGVEGVVAQGDSQKEVMLELKISLQAMLQYFAEEDCEPEDEQGFTTVEEELVLELC